MDIEQFRRKPLMGILRGIEPDALDAVVEASIEGGLETLEITMNTKGAAALIAQAKRRAGDRMAIGAGTVLDRATLDQALLAGASFVVMPTRVDAVIRACLDRGVPVFPGALTPQEIHDAWTAGASMVKVFPSRFFGPEYFREIKGPFGDVELLACGGVSADSLPAFRAAGADAFAFGGSLYDLGRIGRGDLDGVRRGVRALVAAFEGCAEIGK